MSKKLILAANDFGLFEAIDKGIIRACKEGILKNVAIINTSKKSKFLKALKKTKTELGIQLNATKGRPILQSGINSLIDNKGDFLRSGRELMLNAKTKELEKEFYAQLKKAKESFVPRWICCSDEMENNPKIFEIALDIARLEKIPIRTFFPWQKNAAKARSVNTPDNLSEDFYDEPSITLPGFLKILKNLKNGITDIPCRPGSINKKVIEGCQYSWQREIELSTLVNEKLKMFFKEDSSIKLIKFSEIKNHE
tara:strand:+ start:19051 stop:19809 length:759 start_codon:yes stop_codon:yes gene_type:complete